MTPHDPECIRTRSEWPTMARAVGRSVYNLRTALGWSQDELAARAVTSQGTVSRIESGHSRMTPFQSIVLVFRALGRGIESNDVELPASFHGLLGFLGALDGAVGPPPDAMDPSLRRLVAAYQGLRPRQQALFVSVACGMADALGGAVPAFDAVPPEVVT